MEIRNSACCDVANNSVFTEGEAMVAGKVARMTIVEEVNRFCYCRGEASFTMLRHATTNAKGNRR